MMKYDSDLQVLSTIQTPFSQWFGNLTSFVVWRGLSTGSTPKLINSSVDTQILEHVLLAGQNIKNDLLRNAFRNHTSMCYLARQLPAAKGRLSFRAVQRGST